MCVICYQLRNLVGHLVETEVWLNQLRLNMFTYFDVYSSNGTAKPKMKLDTIRNGL